MYGVVKKKQLYYILYTTIYNKGLDINFIIKEGVMHTQR